MTALDTNIPLADGFRDIVGAAHVLEGADMAPFVIDWRRMFHGKAMCVVRPANVEEVSAVMRLCHQTGTAVVPQGGNTGLAGGAVPDDSGQQIVLCLGRMNRIRDLDPTGHIEVEAGAILQTVREAAAGQNRLLPVSIGSEGSATIGGIVSTNAGGANVLRYGMTRELVLGLEVVLQDGQILRANRALRKDNAGFDLKQLFIGSEGAFGIVTAAVLRLLPLPASRETMLLGVAGLEEALAVFDVMQDRAGETLSAFELISAQSMTLSVQSSGSRCPVAEAPWYLLIEVATSLPGLRDLLETALQDLFENELVLDGVLAESLEQSKGLWALREGIAEAEAHAGLSVKHDVSVRPARLDAFLTDCNAVLAGLAQDALFSVFGHLGDGNLHCNVILNKDRTHLSKTVMRAIHDRVAAHDGSISAEHGLGQYRVAEWQRLADPVTQALAARLKSALDPKGVLNPGKVFPLVEAE